MVDRQGVSRENVGTSHSWVKEDDMSEVDPASGTDGATKESAKSGRLNIARRKTGGRHGSVELRKAQEAASQQNADLRKRALLRIAELNGKSNSLEVTRGEKPVAIPIETIKGVKARHKSMRVEIEHATTVERVAKLQEIMKSWESPSRPATQVSPALAKEVRSVEEAPLPPAFAKFFEERVIDSYRQRFGAAIEQVQALRRSQGALVGADGQEIDLARAESQIDILARENIAQLKSAKNSERFSSVRRNVENLFDLNPVLKALESAGKAQRDNDSQHSEGGLPPAQHRQGNQHNIDNKDMKMG
jgi:hypothetical protein